MLMDGTRTGAPPLIVGVAPEPSGKTVVTRRDIAQAIVARNLATSRREARQLLDCFPKEFVAGLASGESVRLNNFGSFIVRRKGKRPGRNRRTGVAMPVTSRKVVAFRASPKLRSAVTNVQSVEKDNSVE